MSFFTSSVKIANRGLQKVGATRITSLDTTVDTSKEADEVNACYDALREAELRRNVWRFSIRRVITRAVGTALPDWDSTVTYVVGSLVTYSNVNYIAILGTNLNQNPVTATTYWSEFTGNTSQKVTFPAWAIGTTYAAARIVTGIDGILYLSLVAGNLAHDPTTDTGTYWQQYVGNEVASAYDSGTTYNFGELVFSTAQVAYMSTMGGNDNAPSTGIGWVTQTSATLAPIFIPWPAGTGPATQDATRSVFVLPYGYLRQAPQDPRAGDSSVLGFPSNAARTDWLLEGNYIISQDPGPLMLRFAADIRQVSLMDALFCEGLACRIGYEVCEPLTQSNTKLQQIGGQYKNFMGDARTVNAIEVGSTQPSLDDYIATRV
jgi:hypothetical protein